jgi:hypothetical protein
MGDHDRGRRDDGSSFCTLAPEKPCDDCKGCGGDGKTYIEVCEPTSWAAGYQFPQLVRAKIKPYVYAKKYEAHHVACVASVTGQIVGESALQDIVRQTKWCINKKNNMLAMPLWGHTVKWYCRITMASAVVDIDLTQLAPPFKNIPQHNFDHGRYNVEVDSACKKVAEKCKKANKEHKLKDGDLAALLDRVSDGFKAMLDKRGKRKDGTHNAWSLGQKVPPDAEWCHPFSMASNAEVTAVGFPVRKFDDKVAAWVAKTSRAMKGPVA